MITQNELKYWFRYDKNTGNLHWIKQPNTRIQIDDVAGILTKKNYIKVGLNNKSYHAHKLIWLYVTGEWPVVTIDHVNRKRFDNRWCNLRLADATQQHGNSIRKSKSGVRGVVKHRKRYVATLCGKTLGRFDSVEEAKAVYDKAAKEYYGEFYENEKEV